jgi:hypothetical protein
MWKHGENKRKMGWRRKLKKRGKNKKKRALKQQSMMMYR